MKLSKRSKRIIKAWAIVKRGDPLNLTYLYDIRLFPKKSIPDSRTTNFSGDYTIRPVEITILPYKAKRIKK